MYDVHEKKGSTAIIIGAGPAGLTAAYEFLDRTDIKPLVLEASDAVGGISRTVEHRGNRMDIGGHRFFSKSDRVMGWWLNLFPLQGAPARDGMPGPGVELPRQAWRRGLGEREARQVTAPDPETEDEVMLVRERLSRILFEGKLYEYPVRLNATTLANLGLVRTLKVGGSYARARLFPVREERSLEDFLINRFGRELYRTFFKDYTEKVWGMPCSEIDPSWGAQRIKGLSAAKAVAHALRSAFVRDRSVAQKDVETSLIERFMYPKYGPGQLWEKVGGLVEEHGGEVRLAERVVTLESEPGRITTALAEDVRGAVKRYEGDYFLSTMPVSELVVALGEKVPAEVREVAEGLEYRNFVTVGLLLRRLRLRGSGRGKAGDGLERDNWIYVQERHLRVSRLQIFNNWSPYLVADPETVWVGMEYICGEGDDIWARSEREMLELAVAEMKEIAFLEEGDVLDGVVVRMAKVYPAYFGTYRRFQVVREYLDRFENLFLLGRNGMHRYNNQDHSMLTAMVAVDGIARGVTDKHDIWSVNVEEEYLEER
ncbi:MAG: NAD(P)/FAD-dependent oxidoreductase [Actinobacteria bacterium]|nr:NAD(P)/FAD-dependent oxidoreductase [Actinomycetota bacterium]